MSSTQTGNTRQRDSSTVDASSNAKKRRPWKRARVACTWCRERKVRCDVSVLGIPCTNCKLDSHKCAVRNHANRLPSNLDSGQPTEPTQSQALTRATENHAAAPTVNYSFPHIESNSFLSIPSDLCLGGSDFSPLASEQRSLSTVITPYPEYLASSSSIPFACYPFLRLDSLHTLPSDDINFLELKGSLRVPEQSFLDVFVRQYFLHVHPCLPVLNEAEFWQMYRAHTRGNTTSYTLSLFVFQALLSSSCVFVPLKTLNKMGFDDSRSARRAFYLRAKLLFDLDAVKSPMDKAQGAILLTYQSSAIDLSAGTHWLSCAIQFGKVANAHLYSCDTQHGDTERLAKKRLWWCILLRDRILPLALRRQIQLTPDQGNLPSDYLDESDLQVEIHNSEVYGATVKRHLITILSLQCQLALAITDLIRIAYAPIWNSLPVIATEHDFSKALNEINDAKRAIRTWADTAETLLGPNSESINFYGSTFLFMKLTYMYYDSARLAASHYEALIWESQQWYSRESYPSKFQSIRADIEDAVFKMTDNVKELIVRGLTCHLPISAVAHTALPLILSAVDTRLSSTRTQLTARQRRMHFYNETMRVLQSRYDAADNVCAFIKNVLSSVNLAGDSNSTQLVTADPNGGEAGGTNNRFETPGSRIKNVCDLFFRQPRQYLRLAMLLDYALSRGQYPPAEDIGKLFRRLRLCDRRSMSPRRLEPAVHPESDVSAPLTTPPGGDLLRPDDGDRSPGNFVMADLSSSDLQSTLQASFSIQESLLNDTMPSEDQLYYTDPAWIDSMLGDTWDATSF